MTHFHKVPSALSATTHFQFTTTATQLVPLPTCKKLPASPTHKVPSLPTYAMELSPARDKDCSTTWSKLAFRSSLGFPVSQSIWTAQVLPSVFLTESAQSPK